MKKEWKGVGEVLRVLGGIEDVQPVRTAMKKSIPAKLPRKETTQVLSRSRMLILRCKRATVENLL